MTRRVTVATLISVALLFSAAAAVRATEVRPPLPPVEQPHATSSANPTTVPPQETGSHVDTASSAFEQPFPAIPDEVDLIDDSRPAPDRGQGPSGQPRELRTLMRRPSTTNGPVPLIVFAHGYDTEPQTYEPLLDAWAAAGYLVAAPELPGSASDLPGTPIRDIADQARDLSFVAASLVERYPTLIDTRRIIAAGHSDGGSAVATIALNSSYADRAFIAYLVMSGAISDLVTDGTWGPGEPDRTLLISVGDNDVDANLAAAHTLFDTTTLPASLVVVPGGDHLGIYVSSSTTATAVRAMTVQLLDTVTTPSTTPPTPSITKDFEVHSRLPAGPPNHDAMPPRVPPTRPQ